MKLRLVRNAKRIDGIFSDLFFEDEAERMFECLEHSYQNDAGEFEPKIPNGTFTCVRGMHQLGHEGNLTPPFSTFEVTGVEGHSGLLFHRGNFNKDSAGCILVGQNIANVGGAEIITGTVQAFEAFLERLDGIDEFELEVS